MNGSGLYIHVPFCRSKCYYCDFYSVAALSKKAAVVEALALEIGREAVFLNSEKPQVRTIYFGGGTPSLLDASDFSRLFDAISDTYNIVACEEITLEANPDDLTPEYIQLLRQFPFNRISIGVQSLNDKELKLINRRHTASEAMEAVRLCKAGGFDNISIDLMYGLPGQTPESFEQTVCQALTLPVTHISSYALSWEEGSVLFHKLKKGVLKEASDEWLETCYFRLNRWLQSAGFIRYELSNFSLPGYESRHNSSYWNGTAYLGVGPGAHSYNGVERRYNEPSIDAYLEGIHSGNPARKTEILDDNTNYNDFVMTRLRTTPGISMAELEHLFGVSKKNYCLSNAKRSLDNGLLVYENDRLKLDDKGLFIADAICSDLIWV
ncbi:MAG: radical SAM family heme chaperone HemW [Bacteroidota bacterium]|nr:radical SAM family heme chaperone HemW [Bacteroidota bacterium]